MLKRKTAPTATLVSLAELKAHLGYDTTDHDTRLTTMLSMARDKIEADTACYFTTQVWERYGYWFPSVIDLRPVSSVSIVWTDYDGVSHTLSSTQYTLLANNAQTKIVPTELWDYSSNNPRHRADAVVTTINVGSATIPPLAQQACLLLCGSWDKYRENELPFIPSEIAAGYSRLIRNLRAGRIC